MMSETVSDLTHMGSINSLSPLLVAFLETSIFGFLIGLEWHSYRRAANKDLGFGTTRTLTLLSILGYGLTVIDPSFIAYGVGLLVIGALLSLAYWYRLTRAQDDRLLSTLIALVVYLLGPLSLHGPLWLPIVFMVVVLLLLGEKPGIRRFSDAFRHDEALTLVKFFLMAGVILPLLPDRQIAGFIDVTWHQVWFAVIVVSAISYLSYLAQTYFFPERGVLLTGILGGMYSSTAATVVLGRRAQKQPEPQARLIGVAVLLATTMMYLRLWVLIVVLGHAQTATLIATPFALLIFSTAALAWWQFRRVNVDAEPQTEAPPSHPLEFSTALLFAFLFVFFATITHFVVTDYGVSGLHVLSFMVGFTDIDPFILSLLDGKFHVSENALEIAILIASGSNNLLKAGYTVALSRNPALFGSAAWLAATFLLSLGYIALFLR